LHGRVRRIMLACESNTVASKSVTDFYPLIARAVAGLEANTGAARRTLYRHARTVLLDQLRRQDPPLTVSEINEERHNLEEAIRKVETESLLSLRRTSEKRQTG